MTKEIKIENWYIVGGLYFPFLKPTEDRICLGGEISEHHTLDITKDFHNVITSEIKEISKTLITTKSGTKYRLGEINEAYLKFLENNNIEYNKENPFQGK